MLIRSTNALRIYQEKSAGEKAVVDSFMQLKATDLGGDPYDSSEDDSLFLVAPGVTKEDNYGCVHMLARAGRLGAYVCVL